MKYSVQVTEFGDDAKADSYGNLSGGTTILTTAVPSLADIQRIVTALAAQEPKSPANDQPAH